MADKDRSIKFINDTNASTKEIDIYNSIVIKYFDEEFSSDNYGNFSIYLGDTYLCFEIDINTKRVISFCGRHPKVKSKDIELPSSFIRTILKVKDNTNLCEGSGARIKFKNDSYYDSRRKIFSIGVIDRKKPIYKFLSNAYIQLDDEGKPLSVIITDICLDSSLTL